jgi:TolA-binding protein
LALGWLGSPPNAQAQEEVGGETKKLKTGGFSLKDFERANFSDEVKQIEIRKHDARLKKIASLGDIVNSNRPYANRADVLFRLAEAQWAEGKYQYLLARDKYDKDYDCWEEKRCATEPAEPVEDYAVPIKLYKDVISQYPQYERIDEVKYYLGRAALDDGKARADVRMQKDGVKFLEDLVQSHPKSKLIARAHLLLGEHFFDTSSLYYAKTHYEQIIGNFKTSDMFDYALYKLGWVYYNLSEYDKTIATFKQVVANVGSGGNRARVEFRSQALNDLVVTWAEVDNGWQDARTYFLKEVGEEDTYDKLDKMAALLVSKDKDEEAIDLYNHLIDHDKVSAKVVEYLDALLEVRRKLQDRVELEKEINRVIADLDHKGAWYKANQKNGELASRADDLVALNLFFLANDYHRTAQKLEDERANAKDPYAKAAHYYKMFLERFPDHRDSYRLSFFYAEILYEQLEDYENASVQYENVIARDKKGDYMEDAALGVIYSIEKLLVKQGLKEAGKEDVEVVRAKKDKTVKQGELKPIPRTDLQQLETRFVAAADTYVELLRDALKDPDFKKANPDRGKMIPNMMFIAAQTFYTHGHFKEAVERLMVIFELYPDHKMANIAVNTIIDAYARLKHWEKIEQWARKLIDAKNFKVKTRLELEEMIAASKTEHAADFSKQRKFDEAIVELQSIVDEFGRQKSKTHKELAATALHNIGLIHKFARRFPEAVAAFEAVIKRYPKEDIAVEAQFEIGGLYESQTKFEEAAAAFMEMRQFKDTGKEKVPKAFLNAGLIYEALEDHDGAYKTFTEYTKLFAKGTSVKDIPAVAFHAAEVLGRKPNDPNALETAAKDFERIARSYGSGLKDPQYEIRATAAAGMAWKASDKLKNRKKATALLTAALKEYQKLTVAKLTPAPETQAYAALVALELAEYAYDDYNAMKLEAVKHGTFSVHLLKKTLIAKGEGLAAAQKSFTQVLDFKSPNEAAAAAFRIGQLYYEFAESLFNAPVPNGLTEDQVIDYQATLGEVAAPVQEKALAAFTEALRGALDKGVYNKWSQKSATFAAKVNPDEFPVSEFRVAPNKTTDTLQSTSFIRTVRRGNTVVDFTKQVDLTKTATSGGPAKPPEPAPETKE